MPVRRRVIFLLATLCGLSAGAAFASDHAFRILHHENVQIRTEPAGAGEGISFEAYGRRFDLRLAPNERVQRAFGARASQAVALRGTVAGSPGSWVRLTRSGGGRWQGMFSDGTDVYAVEPVEAVHGALVQPATAPDGAPIVFRLADAWLPTGAAHCGTVMADEAANALEAYEKVASQDTVVPTADGSPTRRLLVGVIADYEFARFFDDEATGSTAEQAILARMNVVDGIFSAQLGVKIELAAPTVFRDAADPFQRTDANELLAELRRYRAASGAELSRGVTHLMTGRDMDGETVGVAYLGTVCGGGAASSLSEGTRSTTSAALIAAHELGHNFNAPHDGDTNGACASAPVSFLMAPRLNGSQQFSDCSLGQMAALALNGQCLADINPAGAPPPGEPTPGDEQASDTEGGGGSTGLALLIALVLPLLLRTACRAPRHDSGHVRDSGPRRRRRNAAFGIHARARS
jgi:hypothetical protein